MNFIFYYIKNPYIILTTDLKSISIWQSLCAILLGSLAIGSSIGNLNILFILSLFIGLTLIMILNAITIDFIAQLLSYDAKSMILFKSLSLTLLFITFLKPIELLEAYIAPGLSTLLYLCCFGYISHIQCRTIQTTYQSRGLTANLLWMMPSLLSIASIIVITILLSQLLTPFI
tara:strand:- start:511 stop:1032 length:522 start_codon:yes stop_codon:yes gene_type:complete